MHSHHLFSPPPSLIAPNASTPKKSKGEKKIKSPSSHVFPLRLAILEASLEAASIFLPWTETPQTYGFLPWSPLLDFGRSPVTLPYYEAGTIMRAAAIMGWIGVIFHDYAKTRKASYAVLSVSSLLSIASFAMIALTGLTLSWGAYSALASGVPIVFATIAKKLNPEIILETGKDEKVRKSSTEN